MAKALYDRTYNAFCFMRCNMTDKELTKHLAQLSRIEFTDIELAAMMEDMKAIFALMDKVCEFDTSKKPYALDAVGYDDLRADKYADSFPTDKITGNAKNVKNDSFVVPKVI